MYREVDQLIGVAVSEVRAFQHVLELGRVVVDWFTDKLRLHPARDVKHQREQCHRSHTCTGEQFSCRSSGVANEVQMGIAPGAAGEGGKIASPKMFSD